MRSGSAVTPVAGHAHPHSFSYRILSLAGLKLCVCRNAGFVGDTNVSPNANHTCLLLEMGACSTLSADPPHHCQMRNLFHRSKFYQLHLTHLGHLLNLTKIVLGPHLPQAPRQIRSLLPVRTIAGIPHLTAVGGDRGGHLARDPWLMPAPEQVRHRWGAAARQRARKSRAAARGQPRAANWPAGRVYGRRRDRETSRRHDRVLSGP